MSTRKIPGAIPWRGSAARKVLLRDLETGTLDLYEHQTTAKKAWDFLYKHLAEFEKVPFEQFEKQLQAHRLQVLKRVELARSDYVRFRNTRKHLPPPEGLFRDSLTHTLLREDVVAEMAFGSGVEIPSDQFRLRRPEYLAMTPRHFGERLRQERRYQKYINHLNAKREEEPYAEPLAEDGRPISFRYTGEDDEKIVSQDIDLHSVGPRKKQRMTDTAPNV